MLYNLRVRHNFLIIIKECGMGKTSGKSLWADHVHVYGIREYAESAKNMGLSARGGAFYCAYKCIEDWHNLSKEEQSEAPDLPTDTIKGTFSAQLSVEILTQALVNEYGSDSKQWFKQ
jgi:hypothetical protein